MKRFSKKTSYTLLGIIGTIGLALKMINANMFSLDVDISIYWYFLFLALALVTIVFIPKNMKEKRDNKLKRNFPVSYYSRYSIAVILGLVLILVWVFVLMDIV